MRSIKAGLVLMVVFVLSAVTTSIASASPEHIFKVEGKKLEADEKREITAKAKTEFVFTGTGSLGIKSETRCKKLKLNAAEKPVIVGGAPGTSAKELFEFEECTATIGGSKCSSVAIESFSLNNELVTIVLPAAKAGKLAWLFTPATGKVVATFKFKSCGIFGSLEAKAEGTTAAQCIPEKTEQAALALAWRDKEDITEIKKQNGTLEHAGLASSATIAMAKLK